MEQSLVRVLLIEDNSGDVFLLRQALGQEAPCEVMVLPDGDKAFQHLEQCSSGESLPDLVVLDLNLPGKDGIEVLDLIRRRPELCHIPVAVVSSSPTDVLARRAAQADCYITKPTDLDAFLAIGKELLKCVRRVP